MATCPNCGNQTGEGAVFCDQCGTRLPAPEAAVPEAAPAGGSVICPACGAGNVPGEAFCDYCGSPMEAPVPVAEAVPDLEPVSSEAELEVDTEPAEAAPVEAEPAVTEEEAPPAEAEAVVAEEEALPAEAEAVVAEEEAPPAEAEPVVAEEAEAAVAEAPAAVAEGKPTCPACGADVLPGEAFCANCGASLAAAPIPPEPLAEAEAGPATCPACGAVIEPGDSFCSDCGAALEAAPAPAPVEAPVVETPPPAAPAGPRLVAVDSGAEIALLGDEILIGREDPVSGVFPDVDLTPHGGEEGGVSRRHARIFVEGGAYFIEDLDSTNFTFVNKQKLAPKTRQALNDGDEIRCGRVALVLKTS